MKRIIAVGLMRRAREVLPEYMTVSGAIKMARVNGGTYDGDKLTEAGWQWPIDTWFQQRRRAMCGESEPPFAE